MAQMAAPLDAERARAEPYMVMPFADVTLRAGADGASARVHRGVLGFYSRIFLDVLTAPASSVEELPLPGKTAEDLRMLVTFMYPCRSRDEHFTGDNFVRICELGREYDMPELLTAAHEWLVAHADELVLSAPRLRRSLLLHPPQQVSEKHGVQFLKLMQYAHEFHVGDFFEIGVESWAQYPMKHELLKAGAEVARHLDSEVLFQLLSTCTAPAAKVEPAPVKRPNYRA